MIENMDDILSLLLLIALPSSILIYEINKFRMKRKDKALTTSMKHYREW